jgi:hypothetical protein
MIGVAASAWIKPSRNSLAVVVLSIRDNRGDFEMADEPRHHDEKAPATSPPVASPQAHRNEQAPSRERSTSKDEDETTKSSIPVAGPHARKDLQDEMKTPGTGALPDSGSGQNQVDVGPD